MNWIRKTIWLMLGVVTYSTADAQAVTDVMKPLPAAVSQDAPLPAPVAERLAKLDKEKQQKYVARTGKLTVVDSRVMKNEQQYVQKTDSGWGIHVSEEGSFQIAIPVLTIRNTSHGRELVDNSKQGKFNVKQDRMSYALLVNNSIVIYNRHNNPCNMSEFAFSTESEVIRVTGNKLEVIVPVLDIAYGKYATDHKVVCTYLKTGAKYTFDIHMSWHQSIECSQQNMAYCLERLQTESGEDLGLLLNLQTKVFEVVSLPFTFDGDGVNGKDGHKGLNGSNGMHEHSWTDSNGKSHYQRGTRGTPGMPGENGQPGTDGSTFLICLGQDLVAHNGLALITPKVEGGIGGKGGKGGKGGMHGRGSGAVGSAPDGPDGQKGKNGSRGDFLIIEVDANTLIQQTIDL